MNLKGKPEKSCSIYHAVLLIRSISWNLQQAVNGLAAGSSFSELLVGAYSFFLNLRSVGASLFACSIKSRPIAEPGLAPVLI